MKIEKISENKIKVTISLNDLEERNIDLNSLNYNSPAAQELFWDMMEQAEMQYGFNAADAQLVIEATPDTDEGFVVTITKVDEDGDFESYHKYIKNRFKKSDLKVKKKTRKICSAIIVYSFKEFDDIVSLSKKLHSFYTGESTLYKCRDSYYLILTRSNLTTSDLRTFETVLSEYGNKVPNTGFYEGYLNEYGSKIVEFNALEVVNNYF